VSGSASFLPDKPSLRQGYPVCLKEFRGTVSGRVQEKENQKEMGRRWEGDGKEMGRRWEGDV